MSAGRLPDFVIAGEMKTGTTSLSLYLEAHPAVFLAPTRPVRFFDERYDRGLDWYRAEFAGAPADACAGDDTPNYLFDPIAVERMAEVLPSARIIVLLREPVARAWSHYWHHARTGFDARGFEVAVRHELEHGVGARGTPEGSGYLARGCYAATLGRLLDRWPREQVHVGFYEELRDDTAGSFATVCRFLGIDDTVRPDNLGTVYNVGWAPKHGRAAKALQRLPLAEHLPAALKRRLSLWTADFVRDRPMDQSLHDELAAHFAEPNRALEALVGPTPGW